MAPTFDVATPFVVPITVGKADTDGLNHVNNQVYLRWMMQAASAHSESLGYDLARFREIGAVFVVRRHEIDYLAEGLEGDRLAVATWCGEMERVSAYRHFQIVRESDGKTLVRGKTLWIYVDLASGRPTRIPDPVKDAFRPASPRE